MSATRTGALLALLLAAAATPPSAAAQEHGWDLAFGARGGVYAPSAAFLRRAYIVRFAEADIGYAPFVAVEAGLATGRPPTLLRLAFGHAPGLDLEVWRAGCGRGPACALGTARGGVTTVTAEIAAPFSSLLQDWDMAFVGGVGSKRYGWDDLGCAGTADECADADALGRGRSVFTVHLGLEATYELGPYTLLVEVGDYLSSFGVRTEGAAQGQFQNDVVLAAGVRLRR